MGNKAGTLNVIKVDNQSPYPLRYQGNNRDSGNKNRDHVLGDVDVFSHETFTFCAGSGELHYTMGGKDIRIGYSRPDNGCIKIDCREGGLWSSWYKMDLHNTAASNEWSLSDGKRVTASFSNDDCNSNNNIAEVRIALK
eukprot:TRINITY_DN16998_c0_g1_i1.p1 TRINITY_DN16998_c0_g1~~TRINITY_DN16998_c0_g1_i1.p1  ORF type:complete len:139 (+),score=48.10 TRINITY_DN16998_c0_g1_i1:73-489(+)